mmetsp:Transcript_30461/g.73054  ORF Transcript_30461/g.73054 Transcript_30461/m.73054 type:complete len:1011 (-) Transcript_30461:1174-4206(-)|eukprot:CAMPEP_0113624944 /NCGR_PEP_ID=MMETSP0017_2-20120614/12872_1 /TAXON_ID=2856 /ORGANISM="Cylindrotheca closterium" /LENGTH=1010 /DNA_ID=CAMNT_0000535017 /DNA_START=105 /DNA_END=3137 /DNA_ORIENTATION=+ /assembly_acc=CAM_ASM_000147
MIKAVNIRVRSKSNVQIIFLSASVAIFLTMSLPTIVMVQAFHYASKHAQQQPYRIQNHHHQQSNQFPSSYSIEPRVFGSHILHPKHASFLSSSSKLSLSISTDNDDDDNDRERLNDDTIIKMPQKYNISLLLIDHYDSFTYNLYDMLAQLTVEPPLVVTKDAFEGWDETKFKSMDGIILSPGPGSPQEQPALSKEAIRCNPNKPILGVCLGHQLLALEYGANVDKAPVPIHGQDHWIRTRTTTTDATNKAAPDNTLSDMEEYPSIFDGMPPSFRAVRYHSLAAYNVSSEEEKSSILKVTATSAEDDVIQGLQHWKNPHYGVQFHPESIGTQYGMNLLENFCQVTQKIKLQQDESQQQEPESSKEEDTTRSSKKSTSKKVNGSTSDESTKNSDSKSKFRVYVHAVDASSSKDGKKDNEQVSSSIMEPVDAFETFYGDEPRAIWLDSSSASSSGRGALDIMAAPTCVDDVIEHYVDDNDSHDTVDILTQLEQGLFGDGPRTFNANNHASDQRLYIVDSDFETMRNEADDLRDMPDPNLSSNAVGESYWEPLPFEYRGGYLGFLGYEVRHETQRFLQQQEYSGMTKGQNEKSTYSNEPKSSVPDSVFFLARKSMVYHHPTKTWYLIALVEEEEEVASSVEWMQQTASMLTKNDQHETTRPKRIGADATTQVQPQQPLTFVPNRSKEKYKQDIADCHEFIRMGESYELCLTNQLEAEVSQPLLTWNLYQTLRLRNPAPYSAYFCWNIDNDDDASAATSEASFAICSSSPERFMSVKRTKRHPLGSISLQAEAKPIKGTCARVEPQNEICFSDSERREDERRARSLELSLKNRAENLMIVDLLRNDMSRVCQIGSVHVAKLMAIESFATVHQMVSTIRGTLLESENTLDLLRASFPGGSMTGAPKLRTLELLEELEDDVDRGPYAGSLGYLSVNGCMDMNIIIRSAVVTPNENGGRKVAIGAGGAITALSEMEDEYEEMLLKARAVVEAVQTWATARVDNHTLQDTTEAEKSVEV